MTFRLLCGGSVSNSIYEQAEEAKFWLKVVNEIKARGVNNIVVAVVDGLKGFPDAITSVYPQTIVQTCIVHLIRNSMAFVLRKDRKAILPWIKAIFRMTATQSARPLERTRRSPAPTSLALD